MEMTMTTPETKTPEKKTTDTPIVTLKEICAELKIDPYDARQKLRAALKDAPAIAKSHKPKKSWSWPKGSPAIKEVRAVLAK
jgi:hypothetical protein